MYRYLYILSVFLGFNALGNVEDTQRLPADSAAACDITPSELELIEALDNSEQNIQFLYNNRLLNGLLNKLSTCHNHLTETMEQIYSWPSQEEIDDLDDEEAGYYCSLEQLATGCDWIVRIASLIKALQFFYGFVG